jgi:hypothetical protein
LLTARLVFAALTPLFLRERVASVLDSMAQTGVIRPLVNDPWSPHSAMVCLLASALPQPNGQKALPAAMIMRDFYAVSPAEGRRLELGIQPESIRDIRLIRVGCAQIYTNTPMAWWISPIEAVSNGLVFNSGQRVSGAAPPYIKREYVRIPAAVLGEFSRHYGPPRENERKANLALLGRIGRSLRPEQVQEAAE